MHISIAKSQAENGFRFHNNLSPGAVPVQEFERRRKFLYVVEPTFFCASAG